jgi:glucuronate isomerase
VLQLPSNRPQELLKRMKIESMCTTDDPVDVLTAHEKLADQMGAGRIRPTWRPDKAMNIFKPDWSQYIDLLSDRVQEETGPIQTLGDLVAGLRWTHDYFARHGCIASDHALEVPFGYAPQEKLAEKAFQKRRNGQGLTTKEVQCFLAYLLHQFGEMNAKSGWVSQLHIGAVRDMRASIFTALGPDSGGDVSRQDIPFVGPLRDFLNAFDGKLKIVLYCLDPSHLPTLATLSRAFGEQVTVGAAWWLNDSPLGMKKHLEYLATVDLLMNFAGMVTDSRKILSYASRTEMFRRVLAWVLGDWVKRGQAPEDLAIRLAKYICYEGPKKFFGFDNSPSNLKF